MANFLAQWSEDKNVRERVKSVPAASPIPASSSATQSGVSLQAHYPSMFDLDKFKESDSADDDLLATDLDLDLEDRFATLSLAQSRKPAGVVSAGARPASSSSSSDDGSDASTPASSVEGRCPRTAPGSSFSKIPCPPGSTRRHRPASGLSSDASSVRV